MNANIAMRQIEGMDWLKLANTLDEFSNYIPQDHVIDLGDRLEIIEGSVYESIFNLLHPLVNACHKHAGWCLSFGAGVLVSPGEAESRDLVENA